MTLCVTQKFKSLRLNLMAVSDYAWVVDFYDGYVYSDFRDDDYAVRLVRGG